MNNSLSLLKVVNGLSKTLNIANQMIPLYKQVKPLISNSNKVLSSLKGFTETNKIPKKATNQTQGNQSFSNAISQPSTNNPTFFL